MSTTAADTVTSLGGGCSPRRSTMPESPLPRPAGQPDGKQADD